jgi:flagellar hook assembly protein FlgD
MLGRKIAVIQDGVLPSGNHSFEWDGRSDAGETVASGIYFYRLKTGEFDQTKKMTLLR